EGAASDQTGCGRTRRRHKSGRSARMDAHTHKLGMVKPSAHHASVSRAVVLRSSAICGAPIRHIAVLAIANRLGATQALGDMIERVARVQRVGGRLQKLYLSIIS